jgi:hypothetical protein
MFPSLEVGLGSPLRNDCSFFHEPEQATASSPGSMTTGAERGLGMEVWLLKAATTTMLQVSSLLSISFNCWQWSRPVATTILASVVTSGGPSPVLELDAITSAAEPRRGADLVTVMGIKEY